MNDEHKCLWINYLDCHKTLDACCKAGLSTTLFTNTKQTYSYETPEEVQFFSIFSYQGQAFSFSKLKSIEISYKNQQAISLIYFRGKFFELIELI